MRSLSFAAIAIFGACTFLRAQISDFHNADFRRADSIAALYPGHSLYHLKSLADKLTLPLPTEHEKFRAIYTWVCTNIESDYTLFRTYKERPRLKRTEARKKWNTEFSRLMYATLLRDHKTICTGYAYLVRELAICAGLQCVLVHGIAKTSKMKKQDPAAPNHSWNAVLLNGKWYYCDPTWSSGEIDSQTRQFVKKYNEKYFLPDAGVFGKDHVVEGSVK
jgi:transglutaminase/protease-like cytokinesis protein 3